MTDIFLLHRPGIDGRTLDRFLTRHGHDVLRHDDLDLLREAIQRSERTDDRVVVIQEASVESDADFTFLSGCPTLVLGSRHLAPRGTPRELLGDPCFLDDLGGAVNRLAEGREPPDVARAPSGRPAAEPHSRSLLLRGVAHALNNPLSAALGWVQLLSSSNDPRYLQRVTKELGRIEQITHALSLLGRGSSGLACPFDLGAVLSRRGAQLTADGLETMVSLEEGRPAMISADQTEWELMWDLLLGSFHEDRGRLNSLEVVLSENAAEQLVTEIRADGVTLPESVDAERLEDLLQKKIRHSRALGLALARLLVVEQAQGTLEIRPGDSSGTRITMAVPASARHGGNNP